MSHPFEVLDYEGKRVEVDREIVPLIRLLWQRELDTFNSCQDYHGYVWVEFDGPSATEFLNLVAGQDGELRGHMLHSSPIELTAPGRVHAWVHEHGWRRSACCRGAGGATTRTRSGSSSRSISPAPTCRQ